MGTLSKSTILKVARIVNSVLISVSIILTLISLFVMAAGLINPHYTMYQIDYLGYKNVGEKLETPSNEVPGVKAVVSVDWEVIRIFFDSRWLAFWASTLWVGITGALLFILFNLSKFLKSLDRNHAFLEKHSQYLKRIGYGIMGGVISFYLSKFLLDSYLLRSIYGELPRLSPLTMLTFVFIFFAVLTLGFFIYAVGEAFRIGAEMKEEQALTI